MQRRLCGREQEYGMRVSPNWAPSKLHLPPGYQGDVNWRRKFVESLIDNISNVNIPHLFKNDRHRVWLSNGLLMYIDLYCILEVATAECASCSYELILQERASEKILNKLIALVVEERDIDLLTLYKNNVGPSGDGDVFDEVSYASHHNYSYLTSKRLQVFSILKSFVPISIILSGSGHVYRERGKPIYLISQRAPHIPLIESHGTLNDERGIINTRDEPLMHKDSNMSRLHLISRDATRCDFSNLADGWNYPFSPQISRGRMVSTDRTYFKKSSCGNDGC